MDIYLFSLLLGFLGLTAMALVGFIGHGHDGGAHVHAGHDAGVHLGGHDVGGHLGAHDVGHLGGGHDLGVGHAHDVVGHAHDFGAHAHAGDGAAHGAHDLAPAAHGALHGDGAGHAAGAHGHAADHAADTGNPFLMSLIAWLSPRVIFGLLFGFGAAGLLLRNHVPAPLAALTAVVAALAFEVGVLRRIWGLLFRFAGEPAATLEAVWMETAVATTAFDADGDGLVRIELNGEIRQILARLRPEDRRAGVKVHMGDQLRIEEVDPERNECVVAWLGSGDEPEQQSLS